MAPPSTAPIAQEGSLDDLDNHVNSSSLAKIEKKSNRQRGRKTKRRHWTLSEDRKLREFVELHGSKDWKLISEQLPGRSGKGCRLRWLNQLDPKVNKTLFSIEEDEILIKAQKVFGNKWSMIATFLPGRTDNGCKNQWHVLNKNKNVTDTASSGAINGVVSGDHSANGSTGSITLLRKSTDQRTSFSCINPPNPCSVMVANASVNIAGSSILAPSSVVTSLPPPHFFDFLGVGE